MPAPVQYGARPNGRACAYCHLANGSGRPENGTLAGLPAEYIAKQVAAFRDGSRLVANPASNVNSMHTIAKAVADSDVATAAAYFSALQLTRRNRVLEVARVPKTRIEIMLFALDGAGTEPIEGRLVEVPDEWERHELRDPGVHYTTYVPVGALARGRRLVTNGPAGAATACAKCHGPQLLGVGAIPPIAGRSPSNLLRQLINLRVGARHEDGSALMLPVVNALTIDDMVAVAAYVGSRAPSAATAAKVAVSRAH
jgi:cytochrome c553